MAFAGDRGDAAALPARDRGALPLLLLRRRDAGAVNVRAATARGRGDRRLRCSTKRRPGSDELGHEQWPRPFPREEIAAAIERGEVFVGEIARAARRNGHRALPPIPSYWGERPPDAPVHPQARGAHAITAGQGLGAELVAWVNARAAEAGRAFLQARLPARRPGHPRLLRAARLRVPRRPRRRRQGPADQPLRAKGARHHAMSERRSPSTRPTAPRAPEPCARPTARSRRPRSCPSGRRERSRASTPTSCARSARRSCSATPTTCTSGPGEDLIAELGGLHRFMGWDGPILTDSGGFQVFSLRDTLVRVDDDGVTFRSVYDGAAARFTPESRRGDPGAARLRHRDVPRRLPAAADRPRRELEEAVRLHDALGGAAARRAARADGQLLFGIAQGGIRSGAAPALDRGARSSSTSTATRSAASRSARTAARCSRRPPGRAELLPRGQAALLHGHRRPARASSR